MKIGIVGPGAIGLLYTFYLQKSNQNVTLFTRTAKQAEELNETGVTCIRDRTCETVYPSVLPIESMVAQNLDYIFIAVKQYHIDDILPFVEGAASLIFLQNGMSHLQKMLNIGCENIAVGIVEHGAKKEGGHIVHHTGVGVTKFGVVCGQSIHFESVFHSFPVSYFPVQIETDWKEIMHKKLVVNVCINPLTALLGVKNGELTKNRFFYQMMEQVFQEVAFLIRGEKEMVWQMVRNVCEGTSRNTSSMLADVRANRQTEINAIVGYVLEEAKKQQRPVPTLQFLFDAIKGLETRV
ncbi:2-dehydropantoate 2-reductase [Bacillus thuringiensis]|nr:MULTISPECIES: 2-dehydropantoate 2-reductase [Bacillus]MED1154296.1 2-dehydropantoate 2-reductase [Bacillus paranthracis]AJH08624.1 2-dehydropantoate 2-reductase family protein [Bacillus thuringiensis HD1002]AJQ62331.1 2-dehydropantoate 2-reductase [Bacillus thuringiensis serovar morrisoni]AMR88068.1 2-dehydropantoate 2-reductase [Bacillus thuringiensis]AND27470.1 2-dehydropantoate 2-reductase [Bacillus thuringiensis serovar israelensis]